MFFLQPSVLMGLLGLFVPVAIHLIAKRKRHRVVFGSLKFLRASQRRVGRAFNLRQLVLLILRMVILAVLVLAFGRPMTAGGWLASWLGAGGRQAVLLIDTSYSMNALSGNEPLIRLAKNAALAILDSLGAGSKIAVIAFDRDARTLTPGWTTDRSEARLAIENLAVSPKETNLSSALSLLPGLLESAGAGTREIFLLTDMQKSAWSHIDRLSFDESNLRFLAVDCGKTLIPNAAIDSLRLSVIKTLKKSPVRIQAHVVNYGETELTPSCSLYVDDKKSGEQRLYLPASGSTEVYFDFIPGEGEFITGYLALSSDGLGWDNRRYFCVRLNKEIPVTIVDSGSNSNAPDSKYLIRALVPPGADLSTIQPKIVPRLSLTDIREEGIVILTDISQLPAEKWLKSWVECGGHLIVFFNESTQSENADDSLLAGIRFAEKTQTSNEYARLTRIAGIDDTISALLADTQFYQTASLTADSSDPAIVTLAWFDDGRPAVVQKTVERGMVVCLGIPAGTQWTDFPLRVSYLPFMHEIVSLALGEYDADLEVGQPLWFAAGTDRAEITGPEGNKILFDPGENTIPPFAESPGIYRALTRSNGITRELVTAVNLNTIESDPTKLSADELSDLIPNARLIDADGILSTPERRIGISDWTDAALLFLLVLIAAEFFLAGRFAVPPVRREGKRKEESWTP